MKIRACAVGSILMVAAGSAIAGPDEAAVTALLEAQSKIESAFPRTLDIGSILKIYASDSSNFNNGKIDTIEDVKRSLEELEEMVNLGTQVGISSRRTNISAQLLGPGYVFATYDFSTKAAAAGKFVLEESGKCTAIFKKYGAGWKIQHEHCSSLPKEPEIPVVDAEPAPPIP